MALNGYQITQLAALGLEYGFDSQSEFLNTVSTNFSDEFVKKEYNVGTSIDIVLKPRPNPWIQSQSIDPQSTEYDRTSVTVVRRNTSRIINDTDLAVSAKDFFEDVVKPDMRGGVREAERNSLSSILTGPSMLDTASIGQNPANSRIWGSIRAKARKMLMPTNDVFGIMDPIAMSDLSNNESKIFGPTELRDVAALEDRVNKMVGVGKFYDSVDLPRQINGDANCTGVTVNGTQSAGSTLDVTGCGTSKTYLAGQQFWFSDSGVGSALDPEKHFEVGFVQTFTLTQDCDTDGSGHATLVFSPPIVITGSLKNLSAMPASGAAVTFAGEPEYAYKQSLLYHSEAIEFVGLKLPSMQGQGGVSAVKMWKKIPIRSVFFTDYKDDNRYLRYDMFTGICVPYWQHVWRQWGEREAI